VPAWAAVEAPQLLNGPGAAADVFVPCPTTSARLLAEGLSSRRGGEVILEPDHTPGGPSACRNSGQEVRTVRILKRTLVIATFAMGAVAVTGGAPAGADPTCSETLGIAVHGQHIVGDYVAGTSGVTWPPAGQVGSTVGGSGAATPGGPGPGFHFPNGFAPGASFCLEQSNSPGNHPGLG
jgi:hypothetical protein